MNLSNKIAYIALGSVGTIIGLVFGSIFPISEAQEKIGVFDIVTCKQLGIQNDEGDLIAYLGTTDEFKGDNSFINNSDEAVLTFVSAANTVDPPTQMTLTNSTLLFREPEDKILQVGESKLSKIATTDLGKMSVYGLIIFDFKKSGVTGLTTLGFEEHSKKHFLSFIDETGVIIYPRVGDK